ncbi:hypothetical protein ACON3F_10425 [Providencia hangzhouensis]|uniref:hypothetical protein n=1 Tax=Providencia TaxID=586 RepID=UPI00065E064E|nr:MULTISPECIES: hypothetical protein [Providencia]MRF67751.1 hypothetical protein [Escherichia coli]ELR5048347.1 hypothetical protein [Providencia rettgeri]MBG5892202.1 hypothetical protein [Providencia rettgeri]MBI6189432.1 hypothetical protein [Providencia rettgeri]MCG9527842.1 hypothetical protein [Providencia rettgeri]
MAGSEGDEIKYLPWTGAALKVALIMTVEAMKLTPEEAERKNIIVVVGPYARPYKEIISIAEEYGEKEIPKSMRDATPETK